MSKIIKQSDIENHVELKDQIKLSDSEIFASSENKILSPFELKAQAEAEKILRKAATQAKAIRKKAEELYHKIEEKMNEDRQKGFEQGREEAQQKITETLLNLDQKNREWVDSVSHHCLELVYDITAKVLGEKLKSDNEALLKMIKQVLESAMGNDITLYLNADDYQRLEAEQGHLKTAMGALQNLQIKVSDRVDSGGCIVETELGTVDARLENQLHAIRRALNLEDESITRFKEDK